MIHKDINMSPTALVSLIEMVLETVTFLALGHTNCTDLRKLLSALHVCREHCVRIKCHM